MPERNGKASRQDKRLVFEHEDLLSPNLRMLGWTKHRDASLSRLPAHEHQDAFEICYVARGILDWWVGKQVYQVRAGEVFVTWPSEEHGGVDGALQPCELYWMQLAVHPSTRKKRNNLSQLLQQIASRQRQADTVLPPAFEALIRLHHMHAAVREEPKRALKETQSLHLMVEACITTIVSSLTSPWHHAQSASQIPNVSQPISEAIRLAMSEIRHRPSRDHSAETLAGIAGLSVSRFHKRFVDETGQTPMEYLTRMRLQQACELLRETNQPVTKIALDTGFSTSQYFSTVFKKGIGTTPSQYRQEHQSQ